MSDQAIKDFTTGLAGIVASKLAEERSLLDPECRVESHGSTTSSNSPSKDSEDPVLPKMQLRFLLGSLYLASFLAALDTTVVTTLLTVIASDLNAVQNISWIATAYLLSCSALQPIFGKLSDIFGRRILLLSCTALFGLGCCICVTDSLPMIVFGRFVTGCGGSGLTTLGVITMSDLIPLRERGVYQGLANICFGLGAASGGLIGGVVADRLGWKYVFVFQVPLAAIVWIAVYKYLHLPAGSPGLGAEGSHVLEKLKRVDFQGSFLLVSALMIILVAASMGGKEFAFTSWTFAALASLSFVFLGLFVYTECYVANEPIIPLEVMTVRTVMASALANWFYTMNMFICMFFIPLYFQAVMGLSATQSGERVAPNFFSVSLGSVGAGFYMKQTGRYYSLLVVTGIISLLGMARILLMTPEASLFTQYTVIILPGFAYSNMLTVTLLAFIASVPAKFQACTTSVQYTFRATGSTIGVAIGTAIFMHSTRKSLEKQIYRIIDDPSQAAEYIQKALGNTNYVNEAPAFLQGPIKSAYGIGCKSAFMLSAATALVGFISTLFMREHVLHTSMARE